MNWFPWLPDGLAIRAEHQARRGRHREALDHLLALPERGLPLYSDGLVYATNRLRLYQNQFAKSELEEAQRSKVEDLLARLQNYASYTNFKKPITTFTGLDPSHPDDRLLPYSLPSLNGLHLPGS